MTDSPVQSNLYDEEEIYPDCTVQVWRNSVTGECSVGWWINERSEDDDRQRSKSD